MGETLGDAGHDLVDALAFETGFHGLQRFDQAFGHSALEARGLLEVSRQLGGDARYGEQGRHGVTRGVRGGTEQLALGFPEGKRHLVLCSKGITFHDDGHNARIRIDRHGPGLGGHGAFLEVKEGHGGARRVHAGWYAHENRCRLARDVERAEPGSRAVAAAIGRHGCRHKTRADYRNCQYHVQGWPTDCHVAGLLVF